MSVFLDQYSYLHFSTGIIAYFWGVNVYLWTILHLFYEILENLPVSIYIINHYITLWPGGKSYPDPFINSIGDVLSGTVGWLSAYYLDIIGSHYKWYKIHIPTK